MAKYTVPIPIVFDDVEAESADKALHESTTIIMVD